MNEVGRLLTDRESLAFCFKLEYTQIADTIDIIWKEIMNNRNMPACFTFNPNEAKEWFVHAFRPLVKDILGEPYEAEYNIPPFDVDTRLYLDQWFLNRCNISKLHLVTKWSKQHHRLRAISGFDAKNRVFPGYSKRRGCDSNTIAAGTKML